MAGNNRKWKQQFRLISSIPIFATALVWFSLSVSFGVHKGSIRGSTRGPYGGPKVGIQILYRPKADETMSFVEFLEKLDLSEQQYIKAISLSLKHNTLLLKRSPAEKRINCYNRHLLKAWQANMDIQFVLDPYACAVYILSYITKGQRGMSKLLRKACEEAKEGNKNIVSKVRRIGNKFLNAVEISAQEAVYLVLQMPLRRSSREFQFINTSDIDERTFLLKSMDKIKELPDNSPDI